VPWVSTAATGRSGTRPNSPERRGWRFHSAPRLSPAGARTSPRHPALLHIQDPGRALLHPGLDPGRSSLGELEEDAAHHVAVAARRHRAAPQQRGQRLLGISPLSSQPAVSVSRPSLAPSGTNVSMQRTYPLLTGARRGCGRGGRRAARTGPGPGAERPVAVRPVHSVRSRIGVADQEDPPQLRVRSVGLAAARRPAGALLVTSDPRVRHMHAPVAVTSSPALLAGERRPWLAPGLRPASARSRSTP